MRTSLLILLCLAAVWTARAQPLELNEHEYFSRPGVNVMVYEDIYPEGHQGGIGIIQHGERVASNGDLRLEATPGQWQPIPKQHRREVDHDENAITVWLSFPDSSRHLKGFNPIVYPDLYLPYQVRVEGEGEGFRVTVDLEVPLPDEWVGKVGFNIELYPAVLFGEAWYLGGKSGHFAPQPNGPVVRDENGEIQAVPLATGPRLTVAPATREQRLTIESRTGDLMLLDGRHKHNNGWFIVRSLVPAGATNEAIEWYVEPYAIPGWMSEPVIQVSQVGYHPDMPKVAMVELDADAEVSGPITLRRVREDGGFEDVLSEPLDLWGQFLRYNYGRFDFSDVVEPGMYVVSYEDQQSNPFQISDEVFRRHVWQPTLEYFLPVQMCHMRVEEQYRVWHGACHLDDARMAPTDINHFDGYVQGPSTLTGYEGGETVPGLAVGGWHDAGDDDLRIESQANEVWVLASTYELFDVDYDETTIDQRRRLARIHQPDGFPDLLQQVEHGVLNILGGYQALGRLYRGVIVPTLQQYVMLGDPINYTDNLMYDPALAPDERTATHSGVPDDRWVFTEEHAGHEYTGIAGLAIAGRVLRDYNPALARAATEAAEALWDRDRPEGDGFDARIKAATELLLTTGSDEYRQALLDSKDRIVERIGRVGWVIGRAMPLLDDAAFTAGIREAVAAEFAATVEAQKESPYGVPYRPHIWGAGWGVQRFGVEQYLLHRAFPEIVTPEYMLNALNFVLGVHPGSNTASFASGVGARSALIGYGFNRADWSYIPGGVISGTALIRPDFPELKEFPFLWQQVEYVMGGGASNFMFLVLAAEEVLRD